MQISEKILRMDLCDVKGNVLFGFAENYTFLSPKGKKTNGEMLIIKGKDLPLFVTGHKLRLIIYTRAGDRVSYNCDVEISTEQQLNLSLVFSNGLLLEERRRYYKIECAVNCKLVGVERGGRRIEFKNPIGGIVKNINLGGVFLNVTSPGVEFKVDDILALRIPDVMGEELELFSKVLRVQIAHGGELQGYGCCFIGLKIGDEQLIAQYINQLQIEKRKAERAI